MISNSGHDERNKYSGGVAGDNTGTEWQLRSWYNRPWNCVLRHPNSKVAKTISDLSIKAAKNNKVGYDQGQRNTYWQQLQAVGYDPSKITTPCESDCSAGVIANIKAAGHLLGITALQNINATYTGNLRSGAKKAGFTVLTESKYLTGETYLKPGDILLNDAHHVAVYVRNGSISGGSNTIITTSTKKVSDVKMPIIKKGSKGKAVKVWQVIAGVTADGDFGSKTKAATITFQKKYGLTQDGIVGDNTWRKGLESI